ncbi:MAG: hypothetical protein NC416_12615, partial [Eubacterium sp.]|nr:hypothetical protein [Eubacterium sp.]
ALLDYLDAVFEADLPHIDNYVDVRQNPKAMEEVGRMNGLGDSIYERGVAQGMSEGISLGITQGISQGITQGISQGVAQGISQGFDLFAKLINLLLEAGRVDDVKKVSTDETARDRLLREFDLIK